MTGRRTSARAELMTVPKVLEELCDISPRTFYRWRQLGTAPACIKLPNGELRISRDAFADWLDSRREEAA